MIRGMSNLAYRLPVGPGSNLKGALKGCIQDRLTNLLRELPPLTALRARAGLLLGSRSKRVVDEWGIRSKRVADESKRGDWENDWENDWKKYLLNPIGLQNVKDPTRLQNAMDKNSFSLNQNLMHRT